MRWVVMLLLISATATADEILLPDPNPDRVECTTHKVEGGIEFQCGARSVRGPRLPKPEQFNPREPHPKRTYGILFEWRW